MRRYVSIASVGILMLLAMSPAVWGQFTGGSGFVNQSSSTGITSDSSGVTGITFSGAGPHLSAPSGQSLVHTGTLASGATGADHVLDTANLRTAGNLLELRNQGAAKLLVRYDGALVGAMGNLLFNNSNGYWTSNGGFIAQGSNQGFRISGGWMLTASGGTTLSADGVGNLRLYAGGTKSVMVDGKTQISDSALELSHWNAYINEAGNALVFKVKYADGTVKTASVPLL